MNTMATETNIPPTQEKTTPSAAQQPAEKNVGEQINTLISRIRLFEETINEFRKRIIFIEQNLVAYHKKAMTDIKALMSELTEHKKLIIMLEDRILTLIKEMKLLAKKEDVELIKKYVELLNPMKYVTAERVEDLIAEKMEELGREIPRKKQEEELPVSKEKTETEEQREGEIHEKAKKKLNPEDIFKL